MELQAVISALSFLIEYELLTLNFKCVVHTDSAYVLNGATKWIHGWKSRGWLTLQKEQVLNRDLWEKLAYLLDDMPGDEKIEWKLLSGHVGIPGNERCDVIATAYADNKPVTLFDGTHADYTVDLSVLVGDASLQKAKSSGKKRSSAPAYSYLSMVKGEIKTHKTWAECEARVKGVAATKFKKALSASEESQIIAEWKKLA
jgi:ribonuclease HI